MIIITAINSTQTIANTIAITGVTAPVANATQDATAVCSIAGITNSTPSITWSPNHNPFGYATVYTATIVLTASGGYIFPDSGAVTINGNAATSATGWGTGILTVTHEFSATGDAPANSVAITGITIPVATQTPDTTAVCTSEGVGSVSAVTWNPNNNPFAYYTIYTASVTLTAASGYTFASSGTATINGAVATSVSGWGTDTLVVAYQFARTAATPITSVAITGITSPVALATPDTVSACATTGISNSTPSVGWSPAHNPYQYSTVYTASVTLTAATGYVFASSGSATIDGNAATATGWGTNSLSVAYTYPVTGADPDVYIPSGGLILYDGTTAPTGWSFYTAFDNYFIMGGASGASGGAATHVHTQPGMASAGGHSDHTVVPANASGAGQATVKSFNNAAAMSSGHTHIGGSGSGVSTSGAHTHTSPNTGSASSLPPYVRLRWISGGTAVPVGGIVMKNNTSGLPAGYKVCDGTNGTPDMRSKFVYSGTGTASGLSSHAHTSAVTATGGAHTHTGITVTSGTASASNVASSYNPAVNVAKTHNHSKDNLTSGAADPNGHTHTIANTGSTSILPPYITAYYMKRTA